MDVVTVDAFAAFIIVYTLFIVVVLPINSFVEPLVSPLGHSDKLVGLLPLVSLFKLSQSFIAV